MEINISRAYLLLEPELFHLQMLHFPHPRRAKMPFTAEESPLILTSIPELPAELRTTKNFATDLQRSIQFGLSTRQSGSRGELATSPTTVGVPRSILLDDPATRIDMSWWVSFARISIFSSFSLLLLVLVSSWTWKLLLTRTQSMDCQAPSSLVWRLFFGAWRQTPCS